MLHPSYTDSSLNSDQLAAVSHVDGPMMILAGAGSGKTRVITHRAAYLVGGVGLRPQRLLAVTFTNKAATEMRQRAVALGGPALYDAQISTFHRFGVKLLRSHGQRIGINANFSILDAEDQRALLKQVLSRRGLTKSGLGRSEERHILSNIARAKEELISPAEYYAASEEFRLDPELFGEIAGDYERELKSANALDFGDLLARPVVMLSEHPQLLEYLQGWYQHVMVDEYQDVNRAQDALVAMLAAGHSNLVVVGDDDQCIYTWRGANVGLILGFAERYPGAKVVRLTRNYRSSGNILECANGLAQGMVRRHAKELWTEREPGPAVSVIEASDTEDEAAAIARRIAQLANTGVRLSEIAILYRINSQSRELETELRRFNIAYVVRGAPEFYQRREIKDLIAYLRVLRSDSDLVSWRRILNTPPRGIGPGARAALESVREDLGLSVGKTLEAVTGPDRLDLPRQLPLRAAKALSGLWGLIQDLREKAQSLALPDLMMEVFVQSGYQRLLSDDERGQERTENVQSLLDGLSAYGALEPAPALEQFLEDVALVAGGDDAHSARDADCVELMTLHRAKGLEYDCVFLFGFVDGLIPHQRSIDRDLDEERRLAYVGMTRARDRLHISYSGRARRYWGTQSQDPSRFLADLPSRLLEYEDTDGFGPIPPGRESAGSFEPPEQEPLAQFDQGQRVCHNSFGSGLILESSFSGGEEFVRVRFDSGETKKLAVAYAHLSKSE